jgi:hypothetical protein
MKVKTNLIAGGTIANSVQTSCDLCTKATGPIADAEKQADQVVKGVVAGATTFFNCLRQTLG